jgi:hypothetical protein
LPEVQPIGSLIDGADLAGFLVAVSVEDLPGVIFTGALEDTRQEP